MTTETPDSAVMSPNESGEMTISPDSQLGKAIIQELKRQQIDISQNAQPVLVVRQQMLSHSHHEGPIPAPAQLQGYQHIDPSFPDRIIRMTEDQLEHSRQMDRDTLTANKEERARYYEASSYRHKVNSSNERLGIIFAGVISLVALISFIVATLLERGDIAWIPLSIVGIITTGGIGRLLWPKRKNTPKHPSLPED